MSKFFEKYTWKVVAGDFNSPFLRNDIWVKAMQRYPELFDVSSLVIGISSREDTIEYIADLSTWTKSHEEMKRRVEEDNTFVEKIIDTTNALGEKFNEWSEENIFKCNVRELRSKEIFSLMDAFAQKQGALYAYGSTLSILDFLDFSFVECNVRNILKKKLSETDYEKYFEVLTEPIHKSFAQEQEEELLALMAKYYADQEWRSDVASKPLSALASSYPAFYSDLQKHTAKHAWVYYVYSGPAYVEENFLEFIKDHLRKSGDPSKKLEQIKKRRREISSLRNEYIEHLNPDALERMILNLVGKLVWAKPRRKDYQSKSYYHLEKLLKEIARRLCISLSQARSLPMDILCSSFEKENVDLFLVNSIYKSHVCLPDGKGGNFILHGKDADNFCSIYLQREIAEDVGDVDKIKGSVAYKGKASGIVKVINAPVDMHKMRDGDILVSLATTPSIVPAMKKAAAIVTDEGGLTCHASIVSRELGITCIVGTKIATKVFKDGDRVEVDANKGIVKKI